jgi:hypothetical protein
MRLKMAMHLPGSSGVTEEYEMGDLPKPPYPADSDAKGWRFEFDYQKWERTDAWLLLKEEERPFLLMLVLQSWRQVPCSSLPNKPILQARLAGLSVEQWAELSKRVLADWFLASDQRLYHPLLVERVQGMSKVREGGVTRQTRFRERVGGETRPRTKKSQLTLDAFLSSLPPDRAQDLNDEWNGAIAAGQSIVSPIAWLQEINARWDEAGKVTLRFGEAERARRRAHASATEIALAATQSPAEPVDIRSICDGMLRNLKISQRPR